MRRALTLILGVWSTILIASPDKIVNVSKTYSASETADWFYGAHKTKEEKKRLALNLGKVDIQIANNLSCGQLTSRVNVSATLNDLAGQLNQATEFFESFLDPKNIGSVTFAVVCYYKPNICAHVRHFAATLQQELALQFDACSAMDSFLESQANKTQKELQASDYKDCVNKAASREDFSAASMRDCERDARGQTKDILKPLSEAIAGKKQDVLLSVLQVVGKDSNYDLWTSMLGEVELRQDGQWVEAYPKGLLRPEDLAENAFFDAKESTCDTKRLRDVISSKLIHDGRRDLSYYVRRVIRDRIPERIAFALDSLPPADRMGACQALGDSVASAALKEIVNEGRSDLAAALANRNLPEDLKIFYRERADASFGALELRLAQDDVRPLPEVLRMIARYGREFRSLSHDKAAEVSRGKLSNSKIDEECRDQFSCEKL